MLTPGGGGGGQPIFGAKPVQELMCMLILDIL